MQRLQRGAMENIAGQYFQPQNNANRPAEVLFKTQLQAEQAAKHDQGDAWPRVRAH